MHHITTALVVVTPEQALRWLTDNNFARQRPLRGWHVRYLAQAMRGGRFLEGTQIHFVVYNQHKHLVNGQHTLAAILQAGVPMVLNVQETTVTHEEDIARYYGRHDRGLPRSLSDSYQAHGFAALSGLSKTQITELGGAMPLVMSGFVNAASGGYTGTLAMAFRDQDLRWDMMMAWIDEARAFFDAIAGAPSFVSRALTRQGTMSVALVTYRYAGTRAAAFWQAAAQDSGLAFGNPVKTLLRFLGNTPANKHTPPLYARYVASTWNAFWKGRPLSHVYVRNRTAPILLEGTPHTHRGVMRYLTPEGGVIRTPIPAEEMTAPGRPTTT